jgi:hypothetical protein
VPKRKNETDDLFEDVLLEAAKSIAEHGLADQDNAILRQVLDSLADSTMAALEKAMPRMLVEHGAMRSEFEIRLRSPWGPAFDRFEALLVGTSEAAGRFVQRHRAEAEAEEDEPAGYLFWALVRLHIRACCVSNEVFALLRGGFADGALARWRTLHEITVVMAFLVDGKDDDRVERYLQHNSIAAWRSVADHQAFATRLGLDLLTDDEVAAHEAKRDTLVARFGKAYKEEWGWAAAATGTSGRYFGPIEEAAELEHWRPYGRMASQDVHAGPRGLFEIHARPDETPVAGASNYGLQLAGINTAASLALATVILLSVRSGTEEVVMQLVVRRMGEALEMALIQSFTELEGRVAEERRRKRHRQPK